MSETLKGLAFDRSLAPYSSDYFGWNATHSNTNVMIAIGMRRPGVRGIVWLIAQRE
jgi:hypothetical protein